MFAFAGKADPCFLFYDLCWSGSLVELQVRRRGGFLFSLLIRLLLLGSSAQLDGDRANTAITEHAVYWWQAQLEGDKGYNCNLGTRDFLVAGPVGRRQGYNCNLGTRDYLVAGPVGR